VNPANIQFVLLYRTPTEWRISVSEEPGGFGCGSLPDTPPDAPIETAQQDMLDHLRRHWNFTGDLTWQQTKPDWWAAEPTPSPQP
jgi:hypothetical protein